MNTPEGDIQSIFAETFKLAGPERAAYLDRVCAGNAALRQEVESLLAAHARAGDFLNHTVPLPGTGVGLERPGTMIGRYKLLEQIGEGGFGVVYMAEQTEPVQRKVALKIIKPGMDTRQVVARFEAERQALALMDHPNIAKVLDAGATEAGRPYFVMELVRGIPITDYCDQKALSTEERLQLFIQVCHAVQHAHQKGIIHRDLKPSNVMVTLHDGKPVPRVIDFGVAKALGQKLTDKTVFTSFTQMLGTPAYMSPEQAELSGLDVDTRSDIYSLGVLLYELLTGVTPFDKETLARAALDEMRRIIREIEPPKPSTRLQTLGDKLGEVAKHRHAEPGALSRLVRGELDWIVMKCLEKERGRRYETANNVALDLEHYLRREPVSAAAPSPVYVAQKFVRRHKVGLAVVAAMVLLLVAGVVVSTHHWMRADRARKVAEKREAEARENLWASYLATARASRASGQPGRRFAALEAAAKAAAIRPSLELRSEAASALALVDLRTVREWKGMSPETTSLAVDRHFERYARINNQQGPISVRRISDDQELLLLQGDFGPDRFSPDGRFLLGLDCGKGRLAVWNLDTGRQVVESGIGRYCPGPEFHPQAPILAVCYPAGTVGFFELSSGKHWSWTATNIPSGSICFRPDGRQIAVASWHPPGVRVYEADSGKLVASLAHSNAVRRLDWSQDGRWLAAPCADGRIYLWDMSQGGKLDGVLEGHDDVVSGVCFDPQGEFLVSCSWDGTTALWSLSSRSLVLKLFVGIIGPFSFSTDGRCLGPFGTGHAGRTVCLLELERAPEYRTLPANAVKKECNGVFSPDGRWVVAGGDGVQCWDAGSGQRVWTQSVGYVRYVAFRPDGGTLLTTGPTGACEWPWLADVDTREPRLGSPRRLFTSAGGQAEYSRDGSVLVVARRDGLWVSHPHAAAPKVLPMSMCNFACVSPDGRWAAACPWAGWDSDLRVWELPSGRLAYKRPHTQGSLGFTRDGRWLVIAASDASDFRQCLEVGTWRPVADASSEHPASVGHALSADSRWVVLAQGRRVHLMFCELPTLRPFLTLDSPSEYPMCLSQDDGLLLTRRLDGAFALWNLRRMREELRPLGLGW